MEIRRSSGIDDEVVQDQRQRDDNDLQDERQDQPKEEEVEPRRSKRVPLYNSFGGCIVGNIRRICVGIKSLLEVTAVKLVLLIRNGEDFSYIGRMLPLMYQQEGREEDFFPRNGSEKIRNSKEGVTSVSITGGTIEVANALIRTVPLIGSKRIDRFYFAVIWLRTGKGIELLSEVALTEDDQYEEVRKKSLKDFHKQDTSKFDEKSRHCHKRSDNVEKGDVRSTESSLLSLGKQPHIFLKVGGGM
ncbi:hypothetical protein Tco_0923872 [Tanacetum coccineum]|uniref:Uncharacterized protein n=1 Tax=Tanacetum coccineum TaxID=301880 RepID=A0ABQ5D4I8_9ASTR